jgi:hypothetical protein
MRALLAPRIGLRVVGDEKIEKNFLRIDPMSFLRQRPFVRTAPLGELVKRGAGLLKNEPAQQP